uniref:Uncharacterized protein n=1 Tax=Candidatus Kentrum sp. TC TaxID=2126339 RepID=A0A450Z4I9_9GAMM|nr:MAG: hypothetical protein BECKTC1821E_GA0114239_11282 [Candidatus Kentron sp. TC]VFK49559.1 MAG: hypothetical protein BECKTC1821D_GA0114238_10812 [Candidatus Kentron sp. TC]VFK63638.1 MAG: hypothetical protein BECKTC1821F_GA0114240_11026 [Candidatus Kentron sp. TC]
MRGAPGRFHGNRPETRVRDAEDGARLAVLKSHDNEINCLDSSSDSELPHHGSVIVNQQSFFIFRGNETVMIVTVKVYAEGNYRESSILRIDYG